VWTLDKFTEDKKLNNENAKFYIFLIYTPIIILVSWLLEMGVDTPAKNFSAEVDIAARI